MAPLPVPLEPNFTTLPPTTTTPVADHPAHHRAGAARRGHRPRPVSADDTGRDPDGRLRRSAVTGRAINITYVDTGGVLQTEFNVMLPWSKDVELGQAGQATRPVSASSTSAARSSCSITFDGTPIQQRTGRA